VQGLEKSGFVIAIQSEPNAYFPARAIETIALKEIYACLREFDVQARMTMMSPKIAESVLDLTLHIENAAQAVLDERSLSDLIHPPVESAK